MNKNEAFKRFIENLSETLKDKGGKMTGAAILDTRTGNVEGFGSLNPKTLFGMNTPSPESKAVANDILQRLKSAGFPISNQEDEETPENTDQENIFGEEDEVCTCPGCLNFENFEEVLTKKNGHFDYAEVDLGGQKFRIKYFIGIDGKEHLVMQKVDKKSNLNNLSQEQLQQLLSLAVQNKDFERAQILLNTITQLKAKN